MLLEKVKSLDEMQAMALLNFLEAQQTTLPPTPKGDYPDMDKALGYCLKYHHPYTTTAEWMKVLREGEEP